MTTAKEIKREFEAPDQVLTFIVNNIPNNGYATVAAKLGIPKSRTVRDEILTRKPLYDKEIIDACLGVIEFVTGKSPENE